MANQELFHYCFDLFKVKWSLTASLTEFLQYFENQWININNGWYEGYAVRFPSTNNALESTNRIMKMKQHTEKENQWVNFYLF